MEEQNKEEEKDDASSSKNLEIGPGKIICHKYFVSQKIGQGSFGQVYAGYDLKTSESLAIKVEEFQDKTIQKKKEILLKEAKFLYSLNGEKGFPKMIYFTKTESKRIMVMSLLGRNLEHLLRKCNKKFSLKTVLMLADQMISRLEYVHSKDILHRDLKPENFLIGLEKNSNTIYLIDFGLAKKFKEKGVHIPFKEKVGLVGTARYTSINSHLGNEQSRKDDLESLGYILIYFLKGELPWMNLTGATKEEKHKVIVNMKKNTSIEKLCEGLPQEFEEYMNYTKNTLKFEEEPNYSHLKKMFRTLLLNSKFDMNYVFDWQNVVKNNVSSKNQSDLAGSNNENIREKKKVLNKTFDHHKEERKNSKNKNLNTTQILNKHFTMNDNNEILTLDKSRVQTSKAINLNLTNYFDEIDLKELNNLDEFNMISDQQIMTADINNMKINPFVPNKSITNLNNSFHKSKCAKKNDDGSENIIENEANEFKNYNVKDLIQFLNKLETK